MAVPSWAWVDEVKTLKQGDIDVGRGSKQRGLLPSFWENRYKVSEFGRDRAVALHRAEVREDLQYGRRVHELPGKRLLCHCRQNEKCHADNLRDLFRDWHPHAFDPSSSERPPLSSERRAEKIVKTARNQFWKKQKRTLHKAGQAQADPWSSDPGMSEGGCATVKVSVRQAPGLQQTGGILPRYCGQVYHASSSRLLNPSPRFSCCRNLLWVVTRSLRSVKMWWSGAG